VEASESVEGRREIDRPSKEQMFEPSLILLMRQELMRIEEIFEGHVKVGIRDEPHSQNTSC
jgi:hypothetical protein